MILTHVGVGVGGSFVEQNQDFAFGYVVEPRVVLHSVLLRLCAMFKLSNLVSGYAVEPSMGLQSDSGQLLKAVHRSRFVHTSVGRNSWASLSSSSLTLHQRHFASSSTLILFKYFFFSLDFVCDHVTLV